MALVKPTDQKTTAVEKVACHSKFLEDRAATPHRATWGNTRVGQGVEGMKRKHRWELFSWFQWEWTGQTQGCRLKKLVQLDMALGPEWACDSSKDNQSYLCDWYITKSKTSFLSAKVAKMGESVNLGLQAIRPAGWREPPEVLLRIRAST